MILKNTEIKVPKKYHAMIAEIDYEGKESGYWAYAADGYYFEGMGIGCHTTNEYNQAELMKMIRTVKPCESKCDCKRT